MLCKNCTKSYINEKYCPECGLRLIEEKAKKKKNIKVIIIVLIIIICWFTGLGILAANLIPKIINKTSSYFTTSAVGQWKEENSNEILTLKKNNTYEIDNYDKNTHCNGIYTLKFGYEEKKANSYSYQLINNNNIYYTIIFNETCNEDVEFKIIKDYKYISLVNVKNKNQMLVINSTNGENINFYKINLTY